MNFYFTSLFSVLMLLFCINHSIQSQTLSISGQVTSTTKEALPYANIILTPGEIGVTANDSGFFEIQNLSPQLYQLKVSYIGYTPSNLSIDLRTERDSSLRIELTPLHNFIDQVVVTGTMKEVNRLSSPVPVEIYNPVFFKKNPTPNLYEALQTINGVRPQLNCQVCNTGDIHINGLEGPYTMVLIDGMPIVSSLASVYGLSGIPNSIIERVEVVKGPASSLYGSEAIGGLINVITKTPQKAPQLSVDVMATTWAEFNADLGFKFHLKEKAQVLTGINYFNYDKVMDHNNDLFTDVTLQERRSIFQKWQFNRKNNKLFSLAGRYYWEDRWGGETQWTPKDRGGESVYGEAITTKRWELISQYELPFSEKILWSFSFNSHDQNSVYGSTPYLADQKIGFSQLTWHKDLGIHDLLLGTAFRYTYYDDNTPATADTLSGNQPDKIGQPGIFIQDEISFTKDHTVLLGMRYDYNASHGSIFTPRLAYKWRINEGSSVRVNAGTGFRVVNLFTEDHAALTGARAVIIANKLKPERSYNVNLNYLQRYFLSHGGAGLIEISTWYTYFHNLILPDYDSHPNQIIYDNLSGYGVSKGLSVNFEYQSNRNISLQIGASLMDVSTVEEGIKEQQILTERISGTWTLTYTTQNNHWAIDYTGNVYGPMKLPLLGELDPRPDTSPWWSIQNIQLTYRGWSAVEVYGGVKNILNWTPWKNQEEPIIARSFDPFDKQVQFGTDGQVIPTDDNPYGMTFDPSYVYAPNQGIRFFVGFRYSLRQ